jgi:FAD binding domain/Berberine and berberine like
LPVNHGWTEPVRARLATPANIRQAFHRFTISTRKNMRIPTLKQRSGATVNEAAVDSLMEGFHGQIIAPGNPAYDSARQIWNASIDKHPGLIARCADLADVVRAVDFARVNDVVVAIKGGGHNVAGRALCDDGIVIDLSAMNEVSVNPGTRTVRVQGGALLGDIDRATHPHGLAVPTGVVSKTGIGGLALGGGVGWLVRKYGLTCDNILSCEVVTASGEVVIADASTNADLFWGVRGGGGNFGIVTSFVFQTHPVSTVLGGLILYPRDQASAMLRHFRAFMATAPDELTAYAGLISTPEGVPVVGMLPCYCGEPAEGERVLAPLRAFGTPLVDTVQPMPFPEMQKLLDGAFPDRTYNYWKSTFLKDLSDDVLDIILEHANRVPSPLSGVVLELYGGAAARVAPGETAFAQREAKYNVGMTSQWLDPADSDRNIAWTRAMAAALEPYSTGQRFLNFLSDESPDEVRKSFGSNHARLVELKTQYDPANFFSLNLNVPPRG